MAQSVFTEVVYLLIISVCLVAAFRRLKLAPIIAYLLAGVIAGPSVLDLLSDAAQISLVAELGIVFLLFSLGLEFSFPKLFAMRHMVFGIGFAQVLSCLSIVFAICFILGFSWQTSFVASCALALSSTAIVIKQLTETGKLQIRRGQLAVSILLFQDLAVVPMLIAIPIISGATSDGLFLALSTALLKGTVVFIGMIAIGKWVLPRIFNEIAQARSDELFVLTSILIVLVTGAITHFFGLSMALGAFLAGMMLGESQYKHQLEADIRPFRDILMGLFFISVGMQLELSFIAESWYLVLASVAAIMLVKVLMIQLVARLMAQNVTDSWSAGIMLCQMGEFGFVIAALALDHQLINPNTASMIVGIGVVSMGVTPYLVDKSGKLSQLISHQNLIDEIELGIENIALDKHVIICGFGRVGQTVSRFLKLEAIQFVALDMDPTRVREAKAASENIHFGDARKAAILTAANINQAQLVIITFDDLAKTLSVIAQIKKLEATAKILVRTHSDENLDTLIEAGADEVIPETLEGSLMLVSHVLFQSGVPVKRIFGRVRRERKNHYNGLHGFYRGDSSHMNDEDVEFLHAVTLSSDAFAIGLQLNELDLPLRRVEVAAVRRKDKEYPNPDPSIELEAQDIVILIGIPRRVERAERYLLEGR